jgi:hypothetical protein
VALEQREGTRHGECRRCSAFCDKLVEPRGCLEMRCPYLYSYEDRWTGNRYMGCVRKVFRAEIDVEMFERAENAGGFGGLKMTGRPLPQCQFKVEPAYVGSGDGFDCVNHRFFDCTDEGPEALRAFDLRDALGA